MKQNVFALLTFLMLPLRVLAADGDTFTASTVESVTVTYTVISESAKTCKVGRGYIKNQGTVYAVDESVSGSVTIPSQVNGYSVVAVADHAFYNRSNIESISLPSSILEIGGSAFMGCSSLPSIVLPDNVSFIGDRAFCNCSLLSSVNIPEGVSRLEELSFSGCSKLDNLSLPSTISFIGEQAFCECSSLTSIIIPNNAVIGKDGYINASFSGCSSLKTIVFGEGVRIYNKAFGNLQSLVSVTVGNSISTSSEAFSEKTYSNATLYVPAGKKDYYMERDPWKTAFPHIEEITDQILQEYTDTQGVKYTLNADGQTYTVSGHTNECTGAITIPAKVNGCSVICIGLGAFANCTNMTSVTIPDGVRTIDASAFDCCSNLTSITIPSSVTTIDLAPFAGCSSLASIIVDPDNRVYDSREDCNALIHTASNELIAGCKNTIIPNGVTFIWASAFSGCSNLTSITIPNSVTDIGGCAFSGCTSLKDVYCYAESVPVINSDTFRDTELDKATLYVPEGCLMAYKDARHWSGFRRIVAIGTEIPDLEYTDTQGVKYALNTDGHTYTVSGHINPFSGDITIPATVNGCSVTSIGNDAFSCSGLTSVVIPEGVTSIGESAFINCPCMTSATIPTSVTSIGGWAFCNTGISSLNIPTSVASIGECAFGACHALASIQVEDGNTTYDSRDNCNAIIETSSNTLIAGCKNSVIPSTVTSISDWAFYGCSGLTSVTIPNRVTSIGERAFYYCSGLTSVTIPNSVTLIRERAFQACSGLTSMVVENGNAKYDSRDNCNALIETATNTLISGCKNSIIPGSVISIGEGAFQECSGLTSVTIPNSVTFIDNYAFMGCSDLTSITIPKSVAEIWDLAFTGCFALTDVYCYAVDVPTTIATAFGDTNIGNATLHVPAGSIEAYRNAEPWSGFNRIIAIADEAPAQEYTDAQGVIYTLNEDGQTYTVSGHTEACSGAITIPATVNGCSVTSIGEAFGWSCEDLTDVTIPSSVTSIDGGAFFTCSSLVNINLPEGLTIIDEGTFYGCSSLQQITIPSTVTRLGIQAFTGCPFRTLTIPASVQVFDEASLIVSENTIIIMQSSTPPSITQYVLEDALGMQVFSNIIVPDGSKSAYQNANVWNRYSDKIIEVSEAGGILSEEVTIDQVRYKLNYENYTAEVISKADKYSGDVVIPTIVAYERNTYNVTSIGYQAFLDCTGLTSVSIPNSVTSIAGAAFRNCDNLTSVIVDLEVPLEIADNVFPNRANATLYVPAGSVSAYSAANYWKEFNRIEAIVVDSPEQEVTDGQGVKYTLNGDGQTYTVSDLDDAYTGEIIIPAIVNGCSVTSIGYNAFSYCRNMTSVTIPNSVTSIGQWAFWGCSALSSITIPKSVTSIGDYLFHSCSNLTTIIVETGNPVYDSRDNCNAIIETTTNMLLAGCKSTAIPNSVTSFSYGAFYGIDGFTSLSISKNVISIKGEAFASSGLTSIIVDEDNTVYDSRNNCNAIIETATNTLIAGCKNTSIPNNVKAIGNGAFYRSHDLTSVTIPNGVTSIGDWAFGECGSLTSLAIPNGVTSIGSYAFCYCGGITSLSLPNSLTSLGDRAFAECRGLTDVYCFAVNVPTTDANTFLDSNIGNATLHVPAGSIEAYRAAEPWNGFNEIVEIIAGISLNKSEAVLEKTKTMTLTATVYPSNLEDKSVIWKSSNTAVATVSSSGKVKGVKAGTATITCTSNATGAKATCKVTVGYVKLDQTEAILEKTKTLTLTATVYPSKLEDKSVTWKSSNTAVATVSSKGKVKGVKAGTATITCTSNATGLKTTCKVTVGYVKLDQTEATLLKGNTVTLTATVYPSKLEDRSVTWKSSNTKVATVTSAGKVKGVKAGTATITCTSNATGLNTTCIVTVVNGIVTLNKTEVCVQKGKTTTLKATVTPETLTDKSVTWESSDTKIATVTSAGKVKGVKYGTATITCTSVATGAKATCQVTVGKVIISMSEFTLKKSRTTVLTATVYPSTLTDKSVTWESSDKTIATVTAEGKVKGIKAGTATITCTSVATGLKGTCTVTVLSTSGARSTEGDDDETTGIEENAVAAEPFDVYDIRGQKVLHQVTSLDGLPNGIYIVNGRKILKKR